MILGVFKDQYLRSFSSVFWIMAFPALLYVLFSSISWESHTTVLGVVGKSRYFEEALRRSGIKIQIVEFRSADELLKAVKDGKVDAGVDLRSVDAGIAMAAVFGRDFEVRVYAREDSDSKMAVSVLKAIFVGADLRMKGIEIPRVEIERETSRSPSQQVAVFILLAVLEVGLFGIVHGTIELKDSGFLKILSTSPAGDLKRFLALTIPHLVAALLSSSIVLVLGLLKGDVPSPSTAIASIITAAVYFPLGFSIAAGMERTSATVVSNLLFFYSMFFGGMFFGVSGGFIGKLSFINPMRHIVAMAIYEDFNSFVPLVWALFSSLTVFLTLRRKTS